MSQHQQTKDEFHALIHCFQILQSNRDDALEELRRSVSPKLAALISRVARESETSPNLTLADALAILERPALSKEKKALEDAGVNVQAGVDPAAAKAAWESVLARQTETREAAYHGEIDGLNKELQAATTSQERADIRIRMRELLSFAGTRTNRKPLELWKATCAARGEPEATSKQVLRLNAERGPWAHWWNCWAGRRRGFEPGTTVIVGGAAGAGKTSVAAVMAVDALAVGCPVLFLQIELTAEDTIEHLQRQNCAVKNWWQTDPLKKPHRELPQHWEELLEIPEDPSADSEDIVEAVSRFAAKSRKAKETATDRHECNGLVIIDYAQLITTKDKQNKSLQGHEILAHAASRLAKTAGLEKVVVLLLSQLNKMDQREGTAGGVALAGADIQRMASCVFTIQKAKLEEGRWTTCTSAEQATTLTTQEHSGVIECWEDQGDARLISNRKSRGAFRQKDNILDYEALIMSAQKSAAVIDGSKLKDLEGEVSEQSKSNGTTKAKKSQQKRTQGEPVTGGFTAAGKLIKAPGGTPNDRVEKISDDLTISAKKLSNGSYQFTLSQPATEGLGQIMRIAGTTEEEISDQLKSFLGRQPTEEEVAKVNEVVTSFLE
jgi:hypothetical protein